MAGDLAGRCAPADADDRARDVVSRRKQRDRHRRFGDAARIGRAGAVLETPPPPLSSARPARFDATSIRTVALFS